MGFGSSNDDDTGQMLDQQIMEHEAELSQKQRDLAEQRMSIIKSQGEPDYTPHPFNQSS